MASRASTGLIHSNQGQFGLFQEAPPVSKPSRFRSLSSFLSPAITFPLDPTPRAAPISLGLRHLTLHGDIWQADDGDFQSIARTVFSVSYLAGHNTFNLAPLRSLSASATFSRSNPSRRSDLFLIWAGPGLVPVSYMFKSVQGPLCKVFCCQGLYCKYF